MTEGLWFADTSAFSRIGLVPAVEARLKPLLADGMLATCAILDLEALWSARSAEDYHKIADFRRTTLAYFETTDDHLQRALEVQESLADAGQLRSVKLPDLIIAAVAEDAGCGVVHYDKEFDRVAGVTGQQVEWVVPRGSIK